MVARYAPPVSFNFLNLISLDGDKKTIFEKRMGNIDKAVPFFGKGFNKIYPLIMVVYTLLVVTGFFHRIIKVSGIWKRILFQNEADDLDGVDPSGLLILNKERAWLEQGHSIGEEAAPLATNFNDSRIDTESRNPTSGRRDNGRRYSSSSEAISSKYAAIRAQQASNTNIVAAKVSLLESEDSWSRSTTATATDGPSSSSSSTWLSLKSGLHNLKASILSKNKYSPLHNSSDSLDEIFYKLERPHRDEDELDEL